MGFITHFFYQMKWAFKTNKMNLPNIYWKYWCIAIMRIILVLVPQTGYIHPDEYFQSVEVLAGRILHVEAKQPWEFNVRFPIRSMAIPYFTIGASLKMLKNINYFTMEYFNSTVFTPYLIITFPRLLMCLLSFLVDYSLYKICVNNNEKYKPKLIVLGTSYVTLIYATRTFSNAVELILFAVLLHFVAESMTFSTTNTKKREYINLRYSEAKTIVERIKWNKLRSFVQSDSLRNCFIISTITVLGFFNRPTFLSFAVAPVFFWLDRNIGCKSITALHFHLRIIAYVICLVPSIALVILIDSFYYGYISWGEIGMWDVSIDSFVFTPWNFIKYNINPRNLAAHGLHSRYLHVFVNIPLLFNVLGICGIYGIWINAYRIFNGRYHMLPTVRSIKGLMILSMVTPVSILSLFPHQEPRFIIPILVPLVYLHASSIYKETDNAVSKVKKPRSGRPTRRHRHSRRTYLFNLWIVTNVILMMFYGFVHQAGVFPVVSHLSELKKSLPSSTFHIITSHVYSIPEALFAQRESNRLYVTNNTKFMTAKQVFLYEQGSSDLEKVLTKIRTVKSQANKKRSRLFLIMPRSLKHHLEFLLQSPEHKDLSLKVIRTFYPHLSTEAFPDFTEYCVDIIPFHDCRKEKVVMLYQYPSRIVEQFGLDLYKIQI